MLININEEENNKDKGKKVSPDLKIHPLQNICVLLFKTPQKDKTPSFYLKKYIFLFFKISTPPPEFTLL
ncbi:hypothetical protein [Tenacibaculum sp. UWU-22]|uniref:hypothetical protein n=1 Tax=Tenacibaculum sp. UWU-22 TaxID=3234187 RepID=UPI0034DB4784